MAVEWSCLVIHQGLQ